MYSKAVWHVWSYEKKENKHTFITLCLILELKAIQIWFVCQLKASFLIKNTIKLRHNQNDKKNMTIFENDITLLSQT